MGEITVKYVDTGETRCPQAGEWFRDHRGCPVQAIFDFAATRHPICRREVGPIMTETECPLSAVGDFCQAFRITCTGRNLCDLKRRIVEDRESCHEARCRECKEPSDGRGTQATT